MVGHPIEASRVADFETFEQDMKRLERERRREERQSRRNVSEFSRAIRRLIGRWRGASPQFAE